MVGQKISDMTLKATLDSTDLVPVVSSVPSGRDANYRFNLYSLTQYTPSGTGGVTQSLQDELEQRGTNIVGFGADPTGVETGTAAAIIAALTASNSKKIYFPSGTYNFGNVAGGILCDLAPFGDGIEFITGPNVTMFCNTTTAAVSAFFGLNGNNNFTCGRMAFRDDGYDPLINNHGADGFSLYGGTSAWGNVNIAAIDGYRLHAPIEIVTAHLTNRVRNVNIGTIVANDCYYGLVAANQGDNVVVGQILATQTYRAYYVYGAAGHKVNVAVRNPRVSTGQINIATATAGYDTKDIEFDLTARGVAVDTTLIAIDHIEYQSACTISNIRAHYDTEGSAAYYLVRFTNYLGSGLDETNSASTNTTTDIYLSGAADSNARPIEALARHVGTGVAIGTISLASKGKLSVNRGANVTLASSINSAFALGDIVRSAAMTIATSGTAINIGTGGTKTWNYDPQNGLNTLTGNITLGSTGLTMGTGLLTATLPVPSTVGKIPVVARAYDLSATTPYPIYGRISDDGTKIEFTGVTATAPFTWATGDTIDLFVQYPVS